MDKTKDIKFYMIVAITLTIMFGFGFLPPVGQITSTGMQVLGLFFGCIFAWSCGELIWSSILGLILLTIMGFGTMGENFASAYANGTGSMMLVACVFCFGIERCGLLREISKWIVGQKWAQKSPWALVTAFYLAAMVGGAMATNALPPIILLWAVFYGMADEAGIQPYSKLATIILTGISISSYCGAATMPYSSMVVLTRGNALNFDPAFNLDIASFMLLNILVDIIFLLLAVFILSKTIGKNIDYNIPKTEPYKIKLNKRMKWAFGYLLFLVVFMILPGLLPDSNFIKTLFGNTLGLLGTIMLTTVLMMVTRVDGEPILRINEGLSHVPWELILVVGSALAISSFITADGMGVVPTIIDGFTPLVAGKSALTITLLFMVIGLIMTNFINDVVTCVVLYPIAATFISNAGGSVMLLTILFGGVISQGCFMPSGSPVGAMMHANSTWMKSKDVYQYVAILEIILMIAIVIVTIFGHIIGV